MCLMLLDEVNYLRSYILLGIGLVYLISSVVSYRKIKIEKRKYYIALTIMLFLNIVVLTMGMLFPEIGSSKIGFISSMPLLSLPILTALFVVYKIKIINKKNNRSL